MAIEIATVSSSPRLPPVKGPRSSKRRNGKLSPLAFLLLTVALGVVTLVSLATGAVPISPRTIFAAMLGHHPLTETQRLILFHLRLPRVLASGLVGSGLALAGLLFQGLFRNPIADPYVIGSSGGAILGACIGISFFSQWSVFGFSATALLAFAGSAATMALVYSLARSAGKTNVVTLLLAGFAISTMFTNSSYFFELFDKTGTGNRVLASWLHGVIGIPAWTELAVSAALLGLATVAALPLMRTLNTLVLGDEYAQQLGIRVESARVAIILIGSLLTAVAVSLGGMISFAGLDRAPRRAAAAGTRSRSPAAGHRAGRSHLPHACRYPGADHLCSLRGSGGHPDGLCWRPLLPLPAAQDETELYRMSCLLRLDGVHFDYQGQQGPAPGDLRPGRGQLQRADRTQWSRQNDTVAYCRRGSAPGDRGVFACAGGRWRPSLSKKWRAPSRWCRNNWSCRLRSRCSRSWSRAVPRTSACYAGPGAAIGWPSIEPSTWRMCPRLRHRIFNELSGGERQRVKIALGSGAAAPSAAAR